MYFFDNRKNKAPDIHVKFQDQEAILSIDNNEVKIFNMKPYLNKGIFKELRDASLFKTVRPFWVSMQWENGQDLCPDTLYLDSKKAEQVNAPDFI
ncbi:MAG: DUF2442 domain-containing protein [bacterium]